MDVGDAVQRVRRRAVVTGGSRGIGRMITEGLLTNGAAVVIALRNEDQLRASAEEMSHEGPVHAFAAA